MSLAARRGCACGGRERTFARARNDRRDAQANEILYLIGLTIDVGVCIRGNHVIAILFGSGS